MAFKKSSELGPSSPLNPESSEKPFTYEPQNVKPGVVVQKQFAPDGSIIEQKIENH